MLIALGCASPPACPDGEGWDGSACVAFAGLPFDGIRSAEWDGADGLVAGWDAPAWSIGAVNYMLHVADLDGNSVAEVPTSDRSARVTGLEDGEYVLRVIATDDRGEEEDGDRSIRALVGENRLVYRSELAVAGGARAVAGEGELVALGGGTEDGDGVFLIDTADVSAPRTLSTIAGLGEVTDVDLYGGVLAVAIDTVLHPDAPEAVRFYDVSDPAQPTWVGSISADDDEAHTVTRGGDHLYVASTLHGWIAIYDVSDPSEPQRVATWTPPPPAMVHDQAWADGRLYVAYTKGMAILDVTEPSDPELVGILEANWADPFVHNLSPTGDGMTLAMSEEAVGGMLRVYDIEDPSAMTLRGSFQTTEEHSIHNVYVKDDLAFAAWFVDGLYVLDLTDPAEPIATGWYDTSDDPGEPYGDPDVHQTPNVSGANNVWPYGPHVAVADAQRGLILLDYFP